MGILRNFAILLANTLSDIEFSINENSPKSNFYFRKVYLKLLKVQFNRRLRFGKNIYIKNSSKLKIGDKCSIGSFTRIWNYSMVEIGENFMCAGNLTINTGSHDPITLAPISKPIKIGDRVWCGVNVTILSGVTIGDDAIIGAGCVVVNDVPPSSIVVGVPGKPIKYIDRSNVPLHQQHWQ